jgi:hypothetical protein
VTPPPRTPREFETIGGGDVLLFCLEN